MDAAKFILGVLEKFGFPVAFAAGALYLLWWVIKQHRAERKEMLDAHKAERKELAERFEKLDNRADQKSTALITALNDLERSIAINRLSDK